MESKIINGKEYRLVTLRGRAKWIARDGSAYNPIHFNQKATIHMNRDGYPCYGGGVPVHKYVAHGWVTGWFDGAEVDHINYDRTDYRAENLRWVTHLDNIKHSSVEVDHYKGNKCGEKNGRSKMSWDEVNNARILFDKGMKTMDVIKHFHPNYSYEERKKVWNRYNNIKIGSTWS